MKIKLYFIFIFILTSQNLKAENCPFFNHINSNPALRDDPSFWTKYGEVASKGKPSDEELAHLIASHLGKAKEDIVATVIKDIKQGGAGSSVGAGSSASTVVTSYKVEKSKKVKEFLANTNDQVRKNVTDLIHTIETGGRDILRVLSKGGYHVEKIREFKDQYSVRIDRGNRALFTFDGDNLVITAIGKHEYSH